MKVILSTTILALLLVAAASADEPRFLGAQSCAGCHREGPTDIDVDVGNAGFISWNEYPIWSQQDKHALAFKLIDPDYGPRQERGPSNRLSREICDRLGIVDISTARQCLSCHANWVTGHPRPPTYKYGVTCESCHGPSSKWQVDHTLPEWRKLNPQDKLEKYGFVHVRDAAERTQQCLSCHIGNTAQGKVLTHEMFAAGHPPLPGIEIETFIQQMSPHWQSLDQKGSFKYRDEYVAANFPYLAKTSSRELYATRSVVIGGVTTMRVAVELFVDLAAPESTSEQTTSKPLLNRQPAPDGKSTIQTGVRSPIREPDLAAFDCYACHHELKRPSWRQRRGFVSRPGRPTMRSWPTVLVRLGLFHAAKDESQRSALTQEFDQTLRELHEVLNERPFGQPARIRDVGERLVEQLKSLSSQLKARTYDRDASMQLLRHLCSLGTKQLYDYDTARQIAWAMQSIYRGLEPQPPHDAEIKAILQSVSETLRLDLPAGQQRQISGELEVTLATLAQYEPEPFSSQLRQLGKLLGP